MGVRRIPLAHQKESGPCPSCGVLSPELTLKCHACGCDVAIGHEGTKDGDPAILHALPECRAFRELDMLEYLTQMRKHYQAGGRTWPS